MKSNKALKGNKIVIVAQILTLTKSQFGNRESGAKINATIYVGSDNDVRRFEKKKMELDRTCGQNERFKITKKITDQGPRAGKRERKIPDSFGR